MERGLYAQPGAGQDAIKGHQVDRVDGTGVSGFLDRSRDRRGFLRSVRALAITAISAGACSKLDKLFPREGEPAATAEPEAAPNTNDPGSLKSPPRSEGADEPIFLEKELVELKGLALLMAQPDMDRYIFSSVTGNKAFTNVANIRKGDFPYHAFLFKAFDPKSNVNLPARLGNKDKHQSLADFFNGVTRFKGDHSGHVGQIKTILVASYKLSFGIELDPDAIEIVTADDGKISAIKYTAENADRIETTVKVATKVYQDEQDQELKRVSDTDDETHKLVDKRGNLVFPPSISEGQGIAIPPDALKNYETVHYQQRFGSQGKVIAVDLDIPIEAILDERKALNRQNRPKSFNRKGGAFEQNPGWYILDNDRLTESIAKIVTDGFLTQREKMQAILDFAQSYHYVPDSYGDARRTPLMSLICRGGDCDDSSILVVALARAIGIECIFTYFPNHMATACSIDSELLGEASFVSSKNGKRYTFMETTGNGATSVTANKTDPFDTDLVGSWGIGGGHKIGERPKTLPTHVSGVDDREITEVNWRN